MATHLELKRTFVREQLSRARFGQPTWSRSADGGSELRFPNGTYLEVVIRRVHWIAFEVILLWISENAASLLYGLVEYAEG